MLCTSGTYIMGTMLENSVLLGTTVNVRGVPDRLVAQNHCAPATGCGAGAVLGRAPLTCQDAGGLQPDLLTVRVRCRPRHEQRCRLGREQDRMSEHVHVGAKQVKEGRHVRIDALCTTRTIARARA